METCLVWINPEIDCLKLGRWLQDVFKGLFHNRVEKIEHFVGVFYMVQNKANLMLWWEICVCGKSEQGEDKKHIIKFRHKKVLLLIGRIVFRYRIIQKKYTFLYVMLFTNVDILAKKWKRSGCLQHWGNQPHFLKQSHYLLLHFYGHTVHVSHENRIWICISHLIIHTEQETQDQINHVFTFRHCSNHVKPCIT